MENSEKPEGAPPSTPESSKKDPKTVLLPILLGLLILGSLGYIGLTQFNLFKGSQQAPAAPSIAPGASTTSGSIILYGSWEGNKSIIKAYDLEQKQGYSLGTLGLNVKKITVAKPEGFFYIKDVDANDHGAEIAKYNVTDEESSTVIKAEPGFGIDDYMVSPNGQFIVTWEVQVIPGSKAIYGGTSRVYSVNVTNPTEKMLLYDETAIKPIHYPRSISDDGTVFTDMFLPNSGSGWAYGMSVSDFSGQTKREIPSMANGTYGRQPRISPDGTQFVFAGYDGSRGAGTEDVGGEKRAIAVPNTVELLSTQTLKRTKLNLPSAIYDDARFDASGKYVFITKVLDENDFQNTQVLVYDLAKGSVTEIPDSLGERGVSVLPNGDILMAVLNVSPQTLGNLGETYSFVTNNYELNAAGGGNASPVSANDTNMQYIGMVAAKDMSTGVFTEANKEKAKESMQIDTFQLKADLLKDRIRLQSDAAVEGVAPGEGGVAPSAGVRPPGSVNPSGGANPNPSGTTNRGGGRGSSSKQESKAQN